jgi:hypothetical protein
MMIMIKGKNLNNPSNVPRARRRNNQIRKVINLWGLRGGYEENGDK